MGSINWFVVWTKEELFNSARSQSLYLWYRSGCSQSLYLWYRSGCSQSLYLWYNRPVIIKPYHCFQLHTKFFQYLSRLISCADVIIGYLHCGFGWNLSAADCTFCIYHILEKQWEYSLAVYQLFIDFQKTHDSCESGVSVWCPYETSWLNNTKFKLNLQQTAVRQSFVWPILY